MPYTCQIPVGPKSLGDTLYLVEDIDGANNRHIDEDRVKRYKKSLLTLNASPLTLIQRDADTFFIVDGQHRVIAIQEASDNDIEFNAIVWTVEEIHDRGLTFPEFIAVLNSGKTFKGADKLSVQAASSPWVPAFKEAELNPVYRRTRNGLNWSSIIRARFVADCIKAVGRVLSPHVNDAAMLDVWLKSTDTSIEQTIEAVKWWQGGMAIARDRGVSALSTAQLMAIAFVIYDLNQGNPSLEGAPERLTRSANFHVIGRYGAGAPTLMIAKELLRGMNYKKTTHVLTIFDDHGRE